MKAQEIIEFFDQLYPPEFAESWDNVGLLCGDSQKEIKKIFVTLDITLQTVKEAVAWGADMIISHHPILFHGIKQVDFKQEEGKIIVQLIQHQMVVYAAHTNLDMAPHGINRALAELFELRHVEVLEEDKRNKLFGTGHIGVLEKQTTLKEFAVRAKVLLSTPFVRVCGDLEQKVQTVAIVSGSGSDWISNAIQKGADVFVTADLKYHEALDAVAGGLCMIDAGHFPTERIVMELFQKKIEQQLKGLEILHSNQRDIFQLI